MKRIILACTLLASTAHAEFWTGNQLLARINGDSGDQLLALGYVAGAADAIIGTIACPPTSMTLGQVRDMTKRVLENAPSQRHTSADMFVRAALSDWPCKQNNRGSI